MDICGNIGTLTNDLIQVMGALTYGGSLIVSNLGPDALVAGDSFQLFNAASYSGGFTSIILPTLSSGLTWTNKLLVDGSIAVLGPYTPSITNVKSDGTNLIFGVTGGTPAGNWDLLTSTNVVLPVSGWLTTSSGVFDGLGNVSLTNSINFVEPRRFFRIRSL